MEPINPFETVHLTDITFVLKQNSVDLRKVQVPAHKVILTLKSPVFHQWFTEADSEHFGCATIPIEFSYAEPFTVFLRLFYPATLHLKATNIGEVLKLIDIFQVRDCFLHTCEQFLKSTITTEWAFMYYQHAINHDLAGHVKGYIKQFIYFNMQKCFVDGAQYDVNQTTLQQIVQTCRYARNELDIFDGTMMWAIKSLHKNDTKPTAENIQTILGPCLYSIGFPQMKLDDFVRCMERYPNLLSWEVFCDIIHFINGHRPLTIAQDFYTKKGQRKIADIDIEFLYAGETTGSIRCQSSDICPATFIWFRVKMLRQQNVPLKFLGFQLAVPAKNAGPNQFTYSIVNNRGQTLHRGVIHFDEYNHAANGMNFFNCFLNAPLRLVNFPDFCKLHIQFENPIYNYFKLNNFDG